MSFLARHRTICAALHELKLKLRAKGLDDEVKIVDECITYARSMSNKLQQYKIAATTVTSVDHEPRSRTEPDPSM